MSSTQTTTLTNGTGTSGPNSAFVDHVISYPLVSYSFDTYKSFPLGAYTLDLANSAYSRFVTPFVSHPYAQKNIKPLVSPYAQHADKLGDSTLSTIDAHFPIVKSKPDELQSLVLRTFRAPFELADEGKEYVTSIWSDEYKKCGGDGYVAATKAVLTTGLVVTSDTLGTVAQWLQQKKREAGKTLDQATSEGAKKIDHAKSEGGKKLDQAKTEGNKKLDQAKDASKK